jgi:hypothetical protein
MLSRAGCMVSRVACWRHGGHGITDDRRSLLEKSDEATV